MLKKKCVRTDGKVTEFNLKKNVSGFSIKRPHKKYKSLMVFLLSYNNYLKLPNVIKLRLLFYMYYKLTLSLQSLANNM